MDNVKQVYDAYKLHKALGDPTPQIGQIIEKSAHLVATVIGQAKIPGLSAPVRLGTLGIDQAANVYELRILTRYQAELLKARLTLSKQLTKENRAALEKIMQQLGDDQAMNHAFQAWLQKHNLQSHEVTAAALKNTQKNPSIATQFTQGLTIVDPAEGIDRVEKIPCINPDFVAALRQQQALLSQGSYDAVTQAGEVNKYFNVPNPEHIAQCTYPNCTIYQLDRSFSYIPAFTTECAPDTTKAIRLPDQSRQRPAGWPPILPPQESATLRATLLTYGKAMIPRFEAAQLSAYHRSSSTQERGVRSIHVTQVEEGENPLKGKELISVRGAPYEAPLRYEFVVTNADGSQYKSDWPQFFQYNGTRWFPIGRKNILDLGPPRLDKFDGEE